jgi:type VI secretion system protein ImpK
MSSSDKTIIKPRPGGQGSPAIGQDDKTIIKPRPAGNVANDDKTIITPRRKPIGPQTFAPATEKTTIIPKKSSNVIQEIAAYDLPGLPELVQLASPLLTVISQLKQLDGSNDIANLHQYLSTLVTQFTAKAKKSIDHEVVNKASYALCASMDEAILNTPWGENSAWSQKPLLSLFHQETYGGEKFYSILDEEVKADLKHFDLIELMYILLSLGFLGKLRIDKQGQIKAEKIRANTYQLLIKNRNRFKRELSDNTEAIASQKNRLYSFIPIWILVALLTLAAFGVYQQWLVALNKKSDMVVSELASLIPIQQEESLPEDQVREEILFLRKLLQQEIDLGVLSVNDYHNRSAVILHSNELFASGSTEISKAFYPILDKISKAMESLPGRILVSGHTDSNSIRTARYPSNWHLSLARASAVVKYMSASADLKARLLPEGRGDSEPVADNNTAEGRATNRRVVIELFYEP